MPKHARRITMKMKFLLISVLIAITFGMSSCATTESKPDKLTGTQRGEVASLTMELVENDIKLLVMQISTTNSSLQTLIQTEQVDITKAYKEYVATFDATKDTAERFFAHTDTLNVQTQKFFDEWRTQGNEYANPQVQALSEKRRVDLSAVNANVAKANVGVKGALKAYVTTTNEIKTYFSTDLTSKGVAAIVPVSQAAIADGVSLKASLESMYASISAFRAELSTSVAPL
jgi:hypothetical protein